MRANRKKKPFPYHTFHHLASNRKTSKKAKKKTKTLSRFSSAAGPPSLPLRLRPEEHKSVLLQHKAVCACSFLLLLCCASPASLFVPSSSTIAPFPPDCEGTKKPSFCVFDFIPPLNAVAAVAAAAAVRCPPAHTHAYARRAGRADREVRLPAATVVHVTAHALLAPPPALSSSYLHTLAHYYPTCPRACLRESSS